MMFSRGFSTGRTPEKQAKTGKSWESGPGWAKKIGKGQKAS
jgi:hypothetical protein